MAYENLLTSLDNGIFTITINQPKKLNALSKGVFDDLELAVKEVYENDEITGAIITGSGDNEATIPGKCAAPPAPAIITLIPRVWAFLP